jgi:hypothetical protein
MIHTKGKKVEENTDLVIDSLHQNVIDCVKVRVLHPMKAVLCLIEGYYLDDHFQLSFFLWQALVLAVGIFGYGDKLEPSGHIILYMIK